MKQSKDSLLKSFLWISLSSVCFATMAITVKYLARNHISHYQIVFYRVAINFIALAIWIFTNRLPWRVHGDDLKVLVGRGVAGFTGIVCMFYAFSILPLPVATLLSWSSPLFVFLFSFLIFKEKLSLARLTGVIVALLGVAALLISPNENVPHLPLVGVIVALGAAASGGFAYLMVRAATARLGSSIIVLYFSGVATIGAAPLFLLHYQSVPPYLWPTIAAVGLSGTLGQVAMTQAYRYAHPGIVSTMNLLNVAFSSLAGWLWFGEVLTWIQWGGLGVLSLSIAFVAISGNTGGNTSQSINNDS